MTDEKKVSKSTLWARKNPEKHRAHVNKARRKRMARPEYRTAHNAKRREQYKRDPDKARESAKKWFRENPEKAYISGRRTKMRKYGITLEDYERMSRQQGHECAICRKPESTELYSVLRVDHNHATGKVRGLLCHNCNVALGAMADAPSRLRSGAEYLEKFDG